MFAVKSLFCGFDGSLEGDGGVGWNTCRWRNDIPLNIRLEQGMRAGRTNLNKGRPKCSDFIIMVERNVRYRVGNGNTILRIQLSKDVPRNAGFVILTTIWLT